LVGRATAADHVLAGRLGHLPRWRGLFKRFELHDWTRAFESLERVGLLDHAVDRADRLSGGEQQCVATARAGATVARAAVLARAEVLLRS
jgi:phosphonate transport system ATP-binding protein